MKSLLTFFVMGTNVIGAFHSVQAAPATKTHTVVIEGMKYIPENLTVARGGTVQSELALITK
ncbi:MAG: hypothetical protein H7222_00700 [Methylotenera sp.]|nr:hypothetical protein [Oligoflexia bacterium]